MPAFSFGRDAIFTPEPKVALHIGGFPDFYALLDIERSAGRTELEGAITSRAADLLAASFSRGGRSEFLRLLRRHITDFRPVLLDKTMRLAYDEQLRLHEAGDARAGICALEKRIRGAKPPKPRPENCVAGFGSEVSRRVLGFGILLNHSKHSIPQP